MSSHRVLVIEDDHEIREVLRFALESEGYQVETARNGQEGIDLLESPREALPSLILLDLMMPVMDGWQFLEARKTLARASGVPVIVISAAGDKLSTLKDTPYLRKPIELDILLDNVKSYCQAGGPA